MDIEGKYGELIAKRVFTEFDQLRFAEISGDYNPIHVEKAEARKTIIGECIVHGINGLLWALQALYKEKGLTVCSFVAKFKNPILLNTIAYCCLNEKKIRFILSMK